MELPESAQFSHNAADAALSLLKTDASVTVVDEGYDPNEIDGELLDEAIDELTDSAARPEVSDKTEDKLTYMARKIFDSLGIMDDRVAKAIIAKRYEGFPVDIHPEMISFGPVFIKYSGMRPHIDQIPVPEVPELPMWEAPNLQRTFSISVPLTGEAIWTVWSGEHYMLDRTINPKNRPRAATGNIVPRSEYDPQQTDSTEGPITFVQNVGRIVLIDQPDTIHAVSAKTNFFRGIVRLSAVVDPLLNLPTTELSESEIAQLNQWAREEREATLARMVIQDPAKQDDYKTEVAPV